MKTPKLALVQTCKMFPEQYDLVDAHGNRVAYYRLRHGYFSVECPDVGGTLVYEAHPDGDGDFMDYERVGYLAAALAAVKKHYGWQDEDETTDVAPDIKVGHKTPDETKKEWFYCHKELMEILRAETGIIHDHRKLYRSALAYIQQLEAENAKVVTEKDKLLANFEQLEAERDAAVEELDEIRTRNICNSCKRAENGRIFMPGEYGCRDLICAYEKRGVQKEDDHD